MNDEMRIKVSNVRKLVRQARIRAQVAKDEIDNNPRYSGDAFNYSIAHPLPPRAFTVDELSEFTDEELVCYYLGEKVR